LELHADDERTLAIDLAYDAALHTSPWLGFEFATSNAREAKESQYAVRFAREVGATAVVVIGIDSVRGHPALVGALVDLASGREIRRASLALEPTPSETRVRALARFLGGEEPVEGLDVEVGGKTRPPRDERSSPPRRWMLWAGLGGAVLGTAIGGGLALKFHFDASSAGDELDRTCAVSCTPEQVRALQDEQDAANRNAVIAGVAGGAIVITGIVFMIESRLGGASSSATASVVPTSGGFVGFYAKSF
jgi:hypothetical protein